MTTEAREIEDDELRREVDRTRAVYLGNPSEENRGALERTLVRFTDLVLGREPRFPRSRFFPGI
jgi:hypothetical protein